MKSAFTFCVGFLLGLFISVYGINEKIILTIEDVILDTIGHLKHKNNLSKYSECKDRFNLILPNCYQNYSNKLCNSKIEDMCGVDPDIIKAIKNAKM